MKTLQEAEMTRRRWERSISQGSSNEIGESLNACKMQISVIVLILIIAVNPP